MVQMIFFSNCKSIKKKKNILDFSHNITLMQEQPFVKSTNEPFEALQIKKKRISPTTLG